MADDRIVDDLRHARVHAGPESILNLLPARFRATLTFAVGSIWPFVFNEETPEVYTTNAALPAA